MRELPTPGAREDRKPPPSQASDVSATTREGSYPASPHSESENVTFVFSDNMLATLEVPTHRLGSSDKDGKPSLKKPSYPKFPK